MTEHAVAALSPIFSCDPLRRRISGRTEYFCTTLQGRQNLEAVGCRLAGSTGLVGLYVTESAEVEHCPDPETRGRVVALVRVKPMPRGRSTADYPSDVVILQRGRLVPRWPFGWPSEAVFFSPHGGPVLRDAVALALRIHDYASYAGQFLQGPIDLQCMPALGRLLMREIRHDLARNPDAGLKAF